VKFRTTKTNLDKNVVVTLREGGKANQCYNNYTNAISLKQPNSVCYKFSTNWAVINTLSTLPTELVSTQKGSILWLCQAYWTVRGVSLWYSWCDQLRC